MEESSICVYLKKLNLRQRRWLESLKDYDMSVLYHLDIANVVADALSRMTMCSVSHVEQPKKNLVKEVHRLGVRLEDSPNGGLWSIITLNHLYWLR